MGIEFRRGKPYYYRKVRQGGRVVSRYAGGGAFGACLAMLAEADRIEREAEAERWRIERERLEDEERAIAGDFDRVEAAVRELLAAAGYHRRGGGWRKRRGQGEQAPGPSERAKSPAKGPPTMALFERAQKGDTSCQEELDALMDDPERGPRVVEFFGDVPARVELRFVEKVTGDNLAGKGGILRKMAKLRAEMEGPSPSPIERILAERAAYCWLTVWHYEQALVQAKDLTVKMSDFHQRRIDAAHRRFNSSLRTLAQVRKLGLPNIQVNVGRNQVNVAGET